MLSFDEFRAVKNREKNRIESENQAQIQKKQQKSTARTSQSSATGAADDDSKKSASRAKGTLGSVTSAVGDFLEIQQMQALYIMMIVLDTFASLAEICLTCGEDFVLKNSMITRSTLVRMLNSFTTFSSLFYTLEIVVVLIVFGRRIFSHWGYIIDVFTTAGQFYMEYRGYGRANRLLNIFRIWRLMRLLYAMVSLEKDAHAVTQDKLDNSEMEMKKLQLDVATLRSDITKEKEARDAIEAMLMSYKEEVDTLNEALKIAAMDIAEVAEAEEGFDMSEDEIDDEIDGGESRGDSADVSSDPHQEAKGGTGAAAQRTSNKTAMMRAVMEDASMRSKGSVASNTSSMVTGRSGPPTFLVHEDGTFEQK